MLWVFGPTVQLRVTASNLARRDYVTGSSLDDQDALTRETATTMAPTYLNLQFRLEIKV